MEMLDEWPKHEQEYTFTRLDALRDQANERGQQSWLNKTYMRYKLKTLCTVKKKDNLYSIKWG